MSRTKPQPKKNQEPEAPNLSVPQVIAPVEPETPVEILEPMKPTLIRCTVKETFKDGTTFPRFATLGYAGEWPKGEVREITVDLFKKCRSSGAQIEIVTN